MRKLRSAIVIVTVLFLCVEISSRIFFAISWNIPFFKMDKLIWHFYPELKQLEKEYKPSHDKINVLVFGGSAVNPKVYCDLTKQLPQSLQQVLDSNLRVQVYSLAENGHTSLDSKNKLREIQHLHFDYIFYYHGINDSRANNIPDDYFDIDYNHFAYYKLVNILNSHPEKKIIVTPFAIHFIYNQVLQKVHPKPQVPPFYIVLGDVIADSLYWDFGSKIKTQKSFQKNINYIFDNVKSAGNSKLIIFTYAYYHPDNYSLQSFAKKELDYAEQKWPTEIYGQADNVVKAIRSHNEILSGFKNRPEVLWYDFNANIPKNSLYFNDICHLTDKGCNLMSMTLATLIAEDIQKKKP